MISRRNPEKNWNYSARIEEAQQNHLNNSQQAYDEAVKDISEKIQNNLNQIRESCNRVQVGEPICSRGHNIQTYDKLGTLIPNYQSGFIGHIYCPTCGENQHDVTLRNAQTYTLEEWSKKNAEQADEKRKKMQEFIDEQDRKKREIISRLTEEKSKLETESNKNAQERKRLEEEVINQYKKLNEERLNLEKQTQEGKINSRNQEKVKIMERQLTLKKQILENHLQQTEIKRNLAQQELFAYIEQRR